MTPTPAEPTREDAPLLPEYVGDRYRVGRELGRGGMARVYLARDLKHDRDVAIKVIRPEIAATLGHDRFLREIAIAARLRHPNIVPLYDSGAAGDSLYFVMPYEEGASLRTRLDDSAPFPIADAVHILRDVALALGYAHEHGVVHRDVKPDNVILSGGAAVVTDFGIAKAVSAARGEAVGTWDTTLTQPNAGIGTPAYMSPEQAVGDPATDHRADLYSFGCLAYELLTGRPPFVDPSLHQVIASHISSVPPAVTCVRPDVPEPLAALVARCLEKDPAARPQSARELRIALERVAGPGDPPTAGPISSWRGRTVGIVATLVGAAAVAIVLLVLRSRASEPVTIAVLPFGSIGNDSTMGFVADGLTDEVATLLARVPGVQIKSRSGARHYRGQIGVDVTEAGARLKADYLVTAVVRRDGARWVLAAELSRAADAVSLWDEDFHLDPAQQAGAAVTISGDLLDALRARFPHAIGAAPALAAHQRTQNEEAYRLYLRGQEKLARRGRSVQESADLFRASSALDPSFAPAWSGLSMALALYPYFQGVPPGTVEAELSAAAERATSLDPTSARPHIARGLTAWFDYRWTEAERELGIAVQLDPRDVEARVQYARYLLYSGKLGDGMAQLQAARALDPASAVVLCWIAYGYGLQGQFDSALVESQRALENDPLNLSSIDVGAALRAERGDSAGAVRLVALVPGRWDYGYVLAVIGDHAGALRTLQALDQQHPLPWLGESERAFTYLGLGDTARALDALTRATAAHEMWPSLYALGDPRYDVVRASPRFQALLRRIGLTAPTP